MTGSSSFQKLQNTSSRVIYSLGILLAAIQSIRAYLVGYWAFSGENVFK